jgi:hypothetical protein
MGFVSDWISDTLNMAARAFADFIQELERTIRNTVDEVVRTVQNVCSFLAPYMFYIALIVIAIVCWYYAPAYTIAAYTVGEAGATGVSAAAIYAESFYAYYVSFLAAINFKAVMLVHNIAYLFSADYRKVLGQMYNQIGQVSMAIGLGAESLYLFFQNARALVIDGSTALGQRYDMANITWLATFSKYLKTIQGDMRKYTKDPASLIQDLMLYLEKPSQDAKAESMQVIYTSIEVLSGFVNTSLQTLKTLEKDVLRLVADLPESISRYVKPITDRLDKDLNDFVKLVYLPAKGVIDGALKSFGAEQDTQRVRISAITQRIARPGQYLREVDALPPDERFEDESAISEMATRPMIRELQGFEEIVWAETKPEKLEELTAYEREEVEFPAPGKAQVPTVWEEVKVEPLESPFVREDL